MRLRRGLDQVDVEALERPFRLLQGERRVIAGRADAQLAALLHRVETRRRRLLRQRRQREQQRHDNSPPPARHETFSLCIRSRAVVAAESHRSAARRRRALPARVRRRRRCVSAGHDDQARAAGTKAGRMEGRRRQRAPGARAWPCSTASPRPTRSCATAIAFDAISRWARAKAAHAGDVAVDPHDLAAAPPARRRRQRLRPAVRRAHARRGRRAPIASIRSSTTASAAELVARRRPT
jgi:hypothetical protein